MTKISVTGSKSQLETVITELHDMGLMDIEEYEGEDLDTGNPFEEAEELSRTLVHLRSLLSKLPESEESEGSKNLQEIQEKCTNLEETVESIEREKEGLDNEIETLKDTINTLKKLRGVDLDFQDLKGTETLETYTGRIDSEKIRNESNYRYYEIFEGEQATVIAYRPDEQFESLLSSATKERINVPELSVEGSIESVIKEKKNDLKNLKKKRSSKDSRLEEISKEWRGSLESSEEFLAEKVEKAEAPLKFATTDKAFIAEGWIPSEKFEQVQEVLCESTEGKIHIEEEDGENPPVEHDNPSIVKPFESLTDLMSVPKYNEVDPSVVILLTFPALFGFMIGDAGYGLSSFLVFLAGYKMVPAAQDIFKSLMWASFFTVIFGLAFGDAFGYVIFGDHHNALFALTGWEFLKEIPILFHRAEHLGQVLPVAAAFGVFHINLGYLIGFYNEYVNHGFIEAFLEKGSWVLLEISAVAGYLYGATVGVPLGLISVALLYKGEGIEGVVEIPSLVSNILSYLRIFGVAVAAVALAKVVNGLAAPLFEMGTMAGLIGGTAILIFGHTFNTFIKIMEGFLQGIRLHYVEMFGKFYEGGGKKYAPFGASSS